MPHLLCLHLLNCVHQASHQSKISKTIRLTFTSDKSNEKCLLLYLLMVKIICMKLVSQGEINQQRRTGNQTTQSKRNSLCLLTLKVRKYNHQASLNFEMNHLNCGQTLMDRIKLYQVGCKSLMMQLCTRQRQCQDHFCEPSISLNKCH